MMASLNKVFLIGNLTRDPELRQLPSGVSVCKFRIAVNRRFTTSQGEEREETCFVDIESWGRQAETSNRYLSKGRPVLIEGRLQQDTWQDANTGENRSRMLVRARQVQFLGSASGSNGADEQPGTRDEGSNSTISNTPSSQSTEPTENQEEIIPDFEPVDKSFGNIPF
ncbi:MAG: single-stranded DNA-binding protein [Lentisphaeria bacterium]